MALTYELAYGGRSFVPPNDISTYEAVIGNYMMTFKGEYFVNSTVGVDQTIYYRTLSTCQLFVYTGLLPVVQGVDTALENRYLSEVDIVNSAENSTTGILEVVTTLVKVS